LGEITGGIYLKWVSKLKLAGGGQQYPADGGGEIIDVTGMLLRNDGRRSRQGTRSTLAKIEESGESRQERAPLVKKRTAEKEKARCSMGGHELLHILKTDPFS